MDEQTRKIFDDALQLPESARAKLAATLIDSLDQSRDEDAESAWSDEIERRLKEIDSGEVKLLSYDEVRSRLFGRYDEPQAT
jgi:putative addiction module component (TIGR02574 family)